MYVSFNVNKENSVWFWSVTIQLQSFIADINNEDHTNCVNWSELVSGWLYLLMQVVFLIMEDTLGKLTKLHN